MTAIRLRATASGTRKRLIRDFVKNHPEIEVVSEKADDGYSGVNFERPGFQEMMDEIRAGQVDCVIVKDLSPFRQELHRSSVTILRGCFRSSECGS